MKKIDVTIEAHVYWENEIHDEFFFEDDYIATGLELEEFYSPLKKYKDKTISLELSENITLRKFEKLIYKTIWGTNNEYYEYAEFYLLDSNKRYSISNPNAKLFKIINGYLDPDSTGCIRIAYYICEDAGQFDTFEDLRFVFRSHEQGRHNTPHVHMYIDSRDYEVPISVLTGEPLASNSKKIPSKYLKKAKRYILEHQVDFIKGWNALTDGLEVDINLFLGLTKLSDVSVFAIDGKRIMRLFVTGVCGQLGHDVVNNAIARGMEVIGSDIQPVYSGVADGSSVTEAPYVQLNIADREAVFSTIEEIRPDAVIHCAAWTAVDAAEDEENKAKVDAINHLGTQYIAEAAKAVDAKMMYISTDYVFDGKGERPWEPDDKCYAPLNVYGQSKLNGELAVSSILDKYFIVRIAWVFGLNGKNFINTMINVGKTHDTVRVVNDQIGTPTYTADFSRLAVDMIETDKYGYYHATNEGGYISWADLAEEAYRIAGMDVKVVRVSTEEYGLSKVARPYNSRLNRSKLTECGFQPLPDWKDAVKRYIAEAEL